MKSKLRIGIDAQILGKQKGGVELSVEILIRSLAEIDKECEYFLYVTERHPFQKNELPGNFHLCLQGSAAPLLGRLILLPWYYYRDKLNVIYMQRAATFVGCKVTVLHVHDAMYATHPHLFPAWKRRVLNLLFRWSGRKASAVITPTQASRADIVREYGIDPAKIHVIPDTVDTREVYQEKDSGRIEAVATEYKLRRPYVIYLGAIERNKNVHGLVEAFAKFGEKHWEYDLALVGKWRSETRGGYTDELMEQI
jgi:glycosyltransferase involved in cell wall biosynthesis